MIANILLSLLLAPATCYDASDHKCQAEKYLAQAEGGDTASRVKWLYLAHREFLYFFDQKKDDPEILCRARRVLADALALKPTPPHYVERLQKSGHDAAQRERESGARCRPSPGKGAGRARDRDGTGTAIATIPAPASEHQVNGVAPAADDALLVVVQHPTKIVPPVAAQSVHSPGPAPLLTPPGPATPPRRDRSPLAHPGRGLLIAGGLGLFSATVLGGVATYSAVRVDRAASTYGGLAETATGQGYTTPEADMMRRELEADGPYWRSVRIGTSVAAGFVAGAAAALLSVGAVKRRRSLERLTVHPLLPGLLMSARF